MEELFSYAFHPERAFLAIGDIIPKLQRVDNIIVEAAPEWPIEKIAKIDLSILRLSIFELFDSKNTPSKVVIDEAVELAKEYGNENSSKFVNGVLGTVFEKKDKGVINDL